MYFLARSPARRSRLRSPTVAIAVFLFVTACGGGGGGGGDSASSPPPPPPSKLFAGDAVNLAIGSLSDPNPSPGVIAVDRIVIGANTMLTSSLIDFALDSAHDRLYVDNGRSILAFDNISQADGDVSPARVVTSIPMGTNGGYYGIYLDAVNDVLYAGNNNQFTTADIEVYNNVSAANNAAPDRTITIATDFLTSVAVDTTRKILYAYDNSTSGAGLAQIDVYDNVDGLSGNATPDRVIALNSSFSSGPPRALLIDSANDRLYVSGFAKVMVFDGASTKDGSISAGAAPERTISLPVITTSNLALDTVADRLYAVDGSGLNIINNASHATGSVAITRLIAPNGGNLKAVAVAF